MEEWCLDALLARRRELEQQIHANKQRLRQLIRKKAKKCAKWMEPEDDLHPHDQTGLKSVKWSAHGCFMAMLYNSNELAVFSFSGGRWVEAFKKILHLDVVLQHVCNDGGVIISHGEFFFQTKSRDGDLVELGRFHNYIHFVDDWIVDYSGKKVVLHCIRVPIESIKYDDIGGPIKTAIQIDAEKGSLMLQIQYMCHIIRSPYEKSTAELCKIPIDGRVVKSRAMKNGYWILIHVTDGKLVELLVSLDGNIVRENTLQSKISMVLSTPLSNYISAIVDEKILVNLSTPDLKEFYRLELPEIPLAMFGSATGCLALEFSSLGWKFLRMPIVDAPQTDYSTVPPFNHL